MPKTDFKAFYIVLDGSHNHRPGETPTDGLAVLQIDTIELDRNQLIPMDVQGHFKVFEITATLPIDPLNLQLNRYFRSFVSV